MSSPAAAPAGARDAVFLTRFFAIATALCLPPTLFALGLLNAFTRGHFDGALPTDRAWGYAGGQALACAVIALLLALLARRAHRHLFFPALWGIAIVISFLGFDTHTLRERRERRETLERKVAELQQRARARMANGEDAASSAAEVEALGRETEALADGLPGGEGDLYRCSARVMASIVPPATRFQEAIAKATALDVLSLANVKAKSDLDVRLTSLDAVAEANESMIDTMNGMRAHAERCLVERQVPARFQKGYLDAFESQKIGDTIKVREVTRDLVGAMRAMVVLEQEQWGHWHYDAAKEKNVFDDGAVATRWNEGIERVQRLAKDEEAAQRRVLGVGDEL